MSPTNLRVHPVYGAIYKDGEFVQRGAILGLSEDMKEVVIAPVSGWVRLVESGGAERCEHVRGLRVEIWQQPTRTDPTPSTAETRL